MTLAEQLRALAEDFAAPAEYYGGYAASWANETPALALEDIDRDTLSAVHNGRKALTLREAADALEAAAVMEKRLAEAERALRDIAGYYGPNLDEINTKTLAVLVRTIERNTPTRRADYEAKIRELEAAIAGSVRYAELQYELFIEKSITAPLLDSDELLGAATAYKDMAHCLRDGNHEGRIQLVGPTPATGTEEQ